MPLIFYSFNFQISRLILPFTENKTSEVRKTSVWTGFLSIIQAIISEVSSLIHAYKKQKVYDTDFAKTNMKSHHKTINMSKTANQHRQGQVLLVFQQKHSSSLLKS